MKTSMQVMLVCRRAYLWLATVWMTFACLCSPAQIGVPLNGSGVITFNTPLSSGAWSTAFLPPNDAAAVDSATELTWLAQSYSAATFRLPVGVTSASVPAATPLAIRSSSAEKLVTRPVNNAFTPLMAVFTNVSGYDLAQIQITYSFAVLAAGPEEIPGFQVYYSTTGDPGTWSHIPALSGNESPGIHSAILPLGNWRRSTTLYVLWADDNSSGNDAAYAIDDLSVTVPLPSFISPPDPQFVAPGGAITLDGSAVGVLPLQYEWSKDGIPIDGATNATLTRAGVTAADGGEYTVVAREIRGSITNRLVLTVDCVAADLKSQPSSRVVAFGVPFSIDLNVAGSHPFHVTWYKNGLELTNVHPAQTSYSVSTAGLADTGSYVAKVSNCLGQVTSDAAMIAVDCTPLILTNVPVSRTVFLGAPVTLTVGAAGTFPITYQWYRDGVAIQGVTNLTYIVPNAALSDTGVYGVRASNCGGTVSSSNVIVSVLPRPQTVVGLTDTLWHYEQSGVDLGTDWREVNYDDSAWLAGRGIFARENSGWYLPLVNTPLNLTSPSGDAVITYYFRSEFVITNNLNDISLVVSNLFDDGQIVYVNGKEAYRMNMGMGPVGYNTLAPGTTDEGVFWVTNVSSELLVPGTNTIAVEVHQSSTTSADVVMGLHANVVELAPTALAIIEHPADATVDEAKTISLAVRVSGTRAQFQWYKNGLPLPGAAAATLTITNASLADAGLYAVFVSNAVSRVTSRLALVSVVRDTVPPRVIAADWIDPTHLMLTFSEPIDPESVQVSAFGVLLSAGDALPVIAADLVTPTNILLTAGEMLTEDVYAVSITGLRDASPDGHVIAAGSRVPVGRRITLIPQAAFWTFYDPYPPIGDSPEAPQGWTMVGANIPETWGEAPGGFSGGLLSYLPSPMFNSSLSVGPALTAYFRRDFDLPVSRAGLSVFADVSYNDGVVVYLNGMEVERFNVAADGGSDSPAIVALPDLDRQRFELPPNLLLSGRNVVAVELHQSVANDDTKAFALTLDGRYESRLDAPLHILAGPEDAIAREGARIDFGVSATGAEFFQWRINGIDVPGATSGRFTLVPTAGHDGAEISVCVSTANDTRCSSNATLRVLPDITVPRLLSALATNNAVLVRFSEFVSAATAENVANYGITNANGESNLVISAAVQHGSNVLLQTAAPVLVGSILTVAGIRDTSLAGNFIQPGTAAFIGVSVSVVATNSIWRYEESGIDLGAGWINSGFDDTGWKIGGALFYGRSGADQELPLPVSTRLNLSDANGVQVPSYYFRTRFTLPYAVNARLAFLTVVDDGAVFYLNGVELVRLGMPLGTINRFTLASRTVDIAGFETFTTAPMPLLAGENVLAARVHQVNVTSSDFVFAAELKLVTDESILPGAIAQSLFLRRWNNYFALEWDGSHTLQSAPSVTGPWQSLGVEAPFFTSPTGAMMFYRLGP